MIIKTINNEFNDMLSGFPRIELSYETLTHNKVLNNNILLAIPEGIKCFAWFTTFKADNVCLILELDQNNNIRNIKTCLTSFDDQLSYGTIFYGTIFKYQNINCFSIEDIYYYKGMKYVHKQFLDKLDILKHILNNQMSQTALTNNFVIFGLPIISDKYYNLSQELIPYKINHIKLRYIDNPRKILYYKPGKENFNNIRPVQNNIRPVQNNIRPVQNNSRINNTRIQPVVFKITADIQNDVYNLYYINDNKEDFFDFASIPDYNTSVMMNKLFRNIKENSNLDLLEESDDEDEFENENVDKFVDLNKSFNMICKYNHRFKKWSPIELANKTDDIVLSTQIENYGRKYNNKSNY
jgi:hypothetical protein